jgi:hypothetical protein
MRRMTTNAARAAVEKEMKEKEGQDYLDYGLMDRRRVAPRSK